MIARQLKHSDFAAIFACTAGPNLENWSKKLIAEGEAVNGYIVDALGSESVELAINKIETILAEKMRIRGYQITNRFSPGYCGWPTNDQHTLFSLLPKQFCGISLTSSALMLPIKSISGIIGIGAHVKRMAYPCTICDMSDCIRRTIYQMA
jgi:cobalamin-dependent methionine synthase I